MHKINIMMHDFPPNTDPNIFSFTAVIVGVLISEDFTSQELNALGNWFELLGQYILTYAAQQQLLTFRKTNNDSTQQPDQKQQTDYILKAIKKIEDQLASLNN